MIRSSAPVRDDAASHLGIQGVGAPVTVIFIVFGVPIVRLLSFPRTANSLSSAINAGKSQAGIPTATKSEHVDSGFLSKVNPPVDAPSSPAPLSFGFPKHDFIPFSFWLLLAFFRESQASQQNIFARVEGPAKRSRNVRHVADKGPGVNESSAMG
jgi:hypothetical protein